ncbi:hypothetical protein FS749_007245 [Ceratobasidium sp. UAMH 11750]|nr:hypothetical protein FS749_007245 [Ceratobasidium sp. UAMH 11750]
MSSRAGTPGPGLGRSNTTGGLMGMSPGGAGAGDRNAARRELFKKIGGRVEKDRGGDGDQTSGAEDTVLMNGRVTPFVAARVATLGCSRSSGVTAVVDDREEVTQPAALAEPAPATKPDVVMAYSPKPPLNQVRIPAPQSDDDDDATGAKGLARQHSVKLEWDKTLQKLAEGAPSRVTTTHRPPLVEQDDEVPAVTAPSYLGLPTPLLSSTPQPRVPHSSDISVQSGPSIPVFVTEQGALSPYKVDTFPVTISQYHKDGIGMGQVAGEPEDHEVEQVVYPEDPSTKARRTFNESLDRNGGSKVDLTLGDMFRLPTELEQDDDENEETDREVPSFQPYPVTQRVPASSWVSRPSTEGTSSPRAETSTLPPSTPSTAVFSGSARREGDLHGSSGSLVSHVGFPAAASSTSHSSGQGQPVGGTTSAHSLTDWEEVVDNNVPVQPKRTPKKEAAQLAEDDDWDRDARAERKSDRRPTFSNKQLCQRAARGRACQPGERGECSEYWCDIVSHELASYDWSNGACRYVGHVVDCDADDTRWGVTCAACFVDRPALGGWQVACVPGHSETRGGASARCGSASRARGRLHHQASDSRLLSRFQNTGVTPPKQEYIDIRVDSSTPNKSLPTTRDGVKKWLKVLQSPASSGKPARNRKASLTDVLIHRGKGSDSGTERDDSRKTRAKAHPLLERSLSGSDGNRMELAADPFALTPSEITPSPASTHSPSFSATTVSTIASPGNSRPVKNLLRASFVMAQVGALLAAGPDALKPLRPNDPPRKLLLMSPVLQVVNQNTVKDRYLFLFTDLLVIAKPIIVEEDTARDAHKPPLDRTLAVRSVIELHKLHLHSIRDENAPLLVGRGRAPACYETLCPKVFPRRSPGCHFAPGKGQASERTWYYCLALVLGYRARQGPARRLSRPPQLQGYSPSLYRSFWLCDYPH